MAASAVLVCVGSFAPWADGDAAANGLEAFAWQTLLCGLGALVLTAVFGRQAPRPPQAWPLLFIALNGAVAVGYCVVEWNYRRETDELDELLGIESSVGWGLVLVVIGGGGLVLFAALSLALRNRVRPERSAPDVTGSPLPG